MLCLSRAAILPRLSWSLRQIAASTFNELTWQDVVDGEKPLSLFSTETSRRLLAPPCPLAKIVLFGEQHHVPSILHAETQLLQTCFSLASENSKRLILLMEHFHVFHNPILAKWSSSPGSDADFSALKTAYAESQEGFDLDFYRPLLQLAHTHKIQVKGAICPRQMARTVHRLGLAPLMTDESLNEVGYDRFRDVRPTPAHAALIKSLISGEAPLIQLPDLPQEEGEIPLETLKGLSAAQCLKDSFMAFSIDQQVEKGNMVLAIMGSGHLEYGCGVIERIQSVERHEVYSVIVKRASSELFKTDRWPSGPGTSVDERGDDIVADAVLVLNE